MYIIFAAESAGVVQNSLHINHIAALRKIIVDCIHYMHEKYSETIVLGT